MGGMQVDAQGLYERMGFRRHQEIVLRVVAPA
jgi:hypothetical protein